MAAVSVVVVNWNNPGLTEECCASVLAQDLPASHDELELLVVDNGSTDGSAERLARSLPEATVLALPRNLGFGGGANAGIRRASGDVIVLVNNDARAEPGFLRALIGCLESGGSDVGAVTARIVLAGRYTRDRARGLPGAAPLVAADGSRWFPVADGEPGEELLNSTGNEVTRSGNGRDRDWLLPAATSAAVSTPEDVFGFSGGAVALRRAALDDVGLFDESLFMYYEDTELSWRLRRRGWTVRYCGAATVRHRHAATSGRDSPMFLFHNARNRLVVADVHGPATMVLAAHAATAARIARLWLRPRVDGAAASRKTVTAAFIAALRLTPTSLRRRREWTRRARAATTAAPGGAPDGPVGSRRRDPPADRGEDDVPTQQFVLIDGTAIPSRLGGVGRYLEGLVGALSHLDVPFHLVLRTEHVDHFRALAPRATIHTAPRAIDRAAFRFLWEQTGLVRLARRLGVRVLHSPHYTFPLLGSPRRVVTLHDATFFTDPDAHTTVKRLFFSAWIRLAMRGRHTCVVPSLSTARALAAAVPAARADIAVAHHGVDRAVFSPPTSDAIAAVRAHLGLRSGDGWIAFLGTIEPRKNVGNLLRAYARVRAERPDAPTLVVAGARGWDADALAELDRVGPEDGVLEVGYLPRELLAALLGGARVVAYPSIAEGFGLPVLEAMASGACVLTTDRTALPEVGGDAVAYAEPDPDSLRDALERLLGDAAERMRLSGRALDRAAEFTWEACAERHLEAYRSAS